MGNRYGRKKRRAHREEIATLKSKLGVVDKLFEREARTAAHLRERIASGRVELNDVLRQAQGLIAHRTAQALIEAENEFLRSALAQLREQGGARATLEATAPSLDARSAMEYRTVLTVHIPAIYRTFGVDLRGVRRRA